MKTSVSIGRACWQVIACLVAVGLLTARPACAQSINISVGDVIQLINLFKSKGVPAPTVSFTETETHFDLSIVGQAIDDTGSFSSDFTSDFWRGHLNFSQFAGSLRSDTLSMSGDIHHHAGIDRPHPGDELNGDTFKFSEAILSGSIPASGKVTKPFAGEVKHRKNHFDDYHGDLNGQVLVNSVLGNDITTWGFSLVGDHVTTSSIPEPSSCALLGCGILGLLGFGWRRFKRPV